MTAATVRPAHAHSLKSRARAARSERVRTAIIGVLLIALLAGAVTSILESFSGRFTRYTAIRADLPTGQPVDVGNEVQYLGVPVGTVADKGHPLPGGSVRVDLHIKPDKVAAIPANATASVAPSSVFGKEAVILIAPHPAQAHVRPAQLLAASSAGSVSLQGSLSDLDKLLTGIHPAELDTALSAFATALEGQGPTFHTGVAQFVSYLNKMNPDLPTLQNDISLLGPLFDGLSPSIPSLLATLDNFDTTATTLTQQQVQLGQLFSNTAVLTNISSTFLQATRDSLHATLVNLVPLFADVTANPQEISQLLDGLGQLATAFAPAFNGPMLRVSGSLPVDNPGGLLFAGTRALDPIGTTGQFTAAAFASITDIPAPYTSADCPRYGSEHGPNCAPAPRPSPP
ncbi:MAG: MCE family protein, partial [Acidimicrobiales bacterium]